MKPGTRGTIAILAIAFAVIIIILAAKLSDSRDALRRRTARDEFRNAVLMADAGRNDDAGLWLARSLRDDPSSIAARAMAFTLLQHRCLILTKDSVAFMGDMSDDEGDHGDAVHDLFCNAKIGSAIGSPLQHAGEVTAAVFSPDGAWIATSSLDSTVKIWDARTLKAVAPPIRHPSPVLAVAFSPDSRQLVTSGADGVVGVWDRASGSMVGQPFKAGGAVNDVVFYPDGRRVLASQWKVGISWDVASGKEVGPRIGMPLTPKDTSGGYVIPRGGAVVNRAGTKAFASYWPSASINDLATGKHIVSFDVADIASDVNALETVHAASLSPDEAGVVVVQSTDDSAAASRLVFWDVSSHSRIGNDIVSPQQIRSVSYDPEGARIVTGGSLFADVWDVATHLKLGTGIWQNKATRTARFSPDGQRLLVASGNQAGVFDVSTGSEADAPLLASLIEALTGARFDENGVKIKTNVDYSLANFRPSSQPARTAAPGSYDAFIVRFFAAVDSGFVFEKPAVTGH